MSFETNQSLDLRYPSSSDSSLFKKCLEGIALGLIESGDQEKLEEAEPKQIETPPEVKIVTFDDLMVRTIDRRIVQFRPNAVQRKYLSLIAPNWESYDYRMVGIRDFILKARREGITTLIAALYFIDTINNANTTSVEIAHDADTSIRVFGMIKRFYDYLPPEKKRPLKYSNRKELVFDDIDSSFFVGTAGNVHFGRSDTINNAHGTEVAFWPDAGELLTGLEETVPPDGNMVLESTANGLGNYYHEEWVSAENQGSQYRPVFFAWFDFPDYATEPPDDWIPTEEESNLQQTHKLTDSQVYWWKLKKKNKKKKMAQEYPSTPEEAFIASGNPYFDRDRLQVILKSLIKDPEFQPIDLDIPDSYPLIRKYREFIEFYKPPQEKRSYLVGADTAEGLDTTGKLDADSADVLDWDTWEQVCHIHGNWDTHTYGLLLAEIGAFYNNALVAVERNNHGHAVLNALIYSAKYPNVYFDEQYDEHKKESVKKPGWPTTPKTKTLSLDTLATAILELGVHIRSRKTVSELMRFVHLPGGKAGGEGNSHDDRVISLAIACVVALTIKPEKELEFSYG